MLVIIYPFKLFSVSHITAILLTLVGILFLFLVRNKIGHKGKRVLKICLIASLFLSELTFQLWYLIKGEWTIETNLPFQLCSLSIYLCVIMLLTKSYRLFEVTYFASMAGALIAMITPELFYGFPHIRYFQFFIAHAAIILSAFYMIWMEGFHVRFTSVLRAFISLNAIAVVVYFIDRVTGANYMFLAHKPYNLSPIDYLGPYPWYLLSLEFVSFFVFLLLYQPFFLYNKR
ncbi:TIGR02206 family membrane protein [Rossellomorea marisflavi]|uniref:YwaF family protein n=1 Tax=Rossellomorea marisflavi TaxID=189381 RepID=UPI001EE20FBD|nr:TIGR02206 family membrane protein [Rossellomorea marisflavi]UKS67289.1 TIGR02206 family membrane protein [Rossellomorea marisflavi]WJV16968.1 TIGR02206 family membrane protein [Rossellomorea marisflavi]